MLLDFVGEGEGGFCAGEGGGEGLFELGEHLGSFRETLPLRQRLTDGVSVNEKALDFEGPRLF
jgi:hypothetical protein